MNVHSTNEVSFVADRTAALRRMTTEQLRYLGSHKVAYVRCRSRNSARVFALHGADGMPLLAVDTVDAACEVAAGRGLEFVTVHWTEDATSVMEIMVAPRCVTVFFDQYKAPSTAVDQRRIAREIDNAMALAPCDLAGEVLNPLPLVA